MQEETLEEEFEEFVENESMFDFRLAKDLLPFIRSRVEKAREEGYETHKSEMFQIFKAEVITQYKEELLGKLDSNRIMIRGEFYINLSEVKKLI